MVDPMMRTAPAAPPPASCIWLAGHDADGRDGTQVMFRHDPARPPAIEVTVYGTDGSALSWRLARSLLLDCRAEGHAGVGVVRMYRDDGGLTALHLTSAEGYEMWVRVESEPLDAFTDRTYRDVPVGYEAHRLDLWAAGTIEALRGAA